MQTPEPVKVKAVIREVSQKAILPRFRRLERHDISEKNPGDLVTTADREAERLLSAALSKLLPGSKVVGEEAAAANARVLKAFGGEPPVWVVDPVDGTQNFVDGIPCFAVIVALVQANETMAGWIYDPINDAMISARRGEGAWEADRRLAPTRPGNGGLIGNAYEAPARNHGGIGNTRRSETGQTLQVRRSGIYGPGPRHPRFLQLRR